VLRDSREAVPHPSHTTKERPLVKNHTVRYSRKEDTLEQHDESVSFSLLWTIPQVAKALNLGRTKIYELIWKEGLPVQKFGRATRVSPVELQRWLEERERR
jgi:excisionase family DNA binding protein